MKAIYVLMIMMFVASSCDKMENDQLDIPRVFRYLYSVVPSQTWPVTRDTILWASENFQLKLIRSSREGISCYRNDSLIFRCHVPGPRNYTASPSSESCIDYDDYYFVYFNACDEVFDYSFYHSGNTGYARFFELPFDFLEPYGPCSYSVWSYD
jgi:hypothetical protein